MGAELRLASCEVCAPRGQVRSIDTGTRTKFPVIACVIDEENVRFELIEAHKIADIEIKGNYCRKG